MPLFKKKRIYFFYPIFFLCAASSLAAAPSTLNYGIEDSEEAFFVRRIAEFWKDQDYTVVKSQIADFLEKYPQSKIRDHLRGILGDLYLQESLYDDALETYNTIQTKEILDKIVINKLQCLYECNRYSEMLEEGTPYLTNSTEEIELRVDEFHFLMAEAYFRKALTIENQDEKLRCLAKAEPLYEKVLDSAFNDSTMFALAEIYRLQKDNEKAASFFSELAERHKERRDELLFHAGLAQSEFDKSLAIDTFSKIIAQGGVKAKDASINRLILLFQEDQFKDVVAEHKKVLSDLPTDKQVTFDYIIGRSYFALQDYKVAAEWLERYVKHVNTSSPELRNTLLMLLNCAQTENKEDLFKRTLSNLQNTFPEDAELPQALFIHAMMLKDQGKLTEAEVKLREIVERHSHFDDPETLYLEYGLITHANEKWEISHTTLGSFLNQFPDSKHASIAWKYFLSNALNLLKKIENNENTEYSKEVFLSDLNSVLAHKDVLTPNEQKECLFLQGKISYELALYEDALNQLDTYLKTYPQDVSAPETHLVVALCHHKLGDSPQLFCEHAEKALQESSDLKNKASIHLELYNVYLSMIEDSKEKYNALDSEEVYSLAAEHLYQSLSLGDTPIHAENKLWLANFYFDKCLHHPAVYEKDPISVNQDLVTYYERSKSLFQELLISNASGNLKSLEKDHISFEWEVLKYASIMGREGKLDKKISILKSLIEQQNNHNDWDWKLKKEALLELAKTYETKGNLSDAYNTFLFITEHFRKEPSFVSEYANVHAARLRFMKMPQKRHAEENTEIFKILSNLKEYQIRKSPSSEPIHLEAALEYAWIRANIAEDHEKGTKYLFFLNRIKEDYQNMEDPMISTYHKKLNENADHKKVYEMYMHFLELEIKRCESITAAQEGRMAHSIQMANDVKEALLSLQKTTPSYYLNIRSAKSLEALTKSRAT